MERGRKPQPRALKELHGTLEKSRDRREPVPVEGPLQPSDQVDRQPYARAIWDSYLRFAPLGLLKPVDAELLERLCMSLAMARQAMDQVLAIGQMVQVGVRKDEQGRIVDPGTPQQNPYLAIVNRQTEISRKLAAELGLPVTARARIDLPDAPPAPRKGRSKSETPRSLDAFIASKPQATERPN